MLVEKVKLRDQIDALVKSYETISDNSIYPSSGFGKVKTRI